MHGCSVHLGSPLLALPLQALRAAAVVRRCRGLTRWGHLQLDHESGAALGEHMDRVWQMSRKMMPCQSQILNSWSVNQMILTHVSWYQLQAIDRGPNK
jgi:hypothetical protein